ncbi:nitroreductase family protein [Desulfovibrio sp. OttesenSCG-928-F07]|nr:nitroreductase family protein [Desulfovibrio sp. OttesenSCG-928-F07]
MPYLPCTTLSRLACIVVILMLAVTTACAPNLSNLTQSTLATITLPEVNKYNSMPLMEALSKRRTTRTLASTPLTRHELAGVLWSAWGINRENGKRTVPTALNTQQVVLYIVLENGIWAYDAKLHALIPVIEGDYRAEFGNAGATLLYAGPQNSYAPMHIGSMYQNVGLYCAAQGLGNVVKMSGKDKLAAALPLPNGYSVYITQNVGYPE